MITITINGKTVAAEAGDTILDAARRAEIYVPTLCHHPDLPPRKREKPVRSVYQGETKVDNDPSKTPIDGLESGCGLCVVEVAGVGELQAACTTPVSEHMEITTESDHIRARRQDKLLGILANHPHACLTCAQQEGCPRTQCSANVPENERCCPQLGNCELQKLANYIGIIPSTPKWLPTNLPNLDEEPLFTRDYNLCIGCIRCVRACRQLRGIEAIGFVVDTGGKLSVGSIEPNLKDSGCRFCTACVQVCPTGAIADRNLKSKTEDLLPCKAACPAGVDIPAYLRFVASGRADEALAVIRESVPLPGILGRVCVRPCEDVCRRGELNEPISICALKRFASDNSRDSWNAKAGMKPDTGKRVAVVGSGPAGLTVAYYLRRLGHAVTVFDSNEKPGGMMRYGIPRYRLPDYVLDKEIGDIFALGVDFQPNTLVGKDLTLTDLKTDFDAVFIGTGAPLSKTIPLNGGDLPQVLWGVDFLRKISLGRDVSLPAKVVVIGGGAVAMDVARTARRLGAREVHMVCLEDRNDMPAHPWEIRDAEEEGIIIQNCWGPMEVVAQAGAVKGICFKKCVGVLDPQGRFDPSYDEECTMGLDADAVILAIGQSSDLAVVKDAGVEVERNLVKADEQTYATSVKGIFAGGDVVAFPGAIVHAIAAGRRAASSIDTYLGGIGEIAENLVELSPLNPWLGRDEGFPYRPRLSTRKISLSERTVFEEVDLGFADGEAALEAARCLQCDLRLAMSNVQFPPEHLLLFTEENVMKAPESEGAFRLMDETKKPIVIKGTANIRELLHEYLELDKATRYFDFEENKMYSKRESELIQQHVQKYGEMPGGGSELDDLF